VRPTDERELALFRKMPKRSWRGRQPKPVPSGNNFIPAQRLHVGGCAKVIKGTRLGGQSGGYVEVDREEVLVAAFGESPDWSGKS
jgi:hypothetical protein